MTLRRTPCVGTCSTTYGDLVCRGCKRFAHEIVQWNGFDTDQRKLVWERLLALRSGAVSAVLEVHDEVRLRRFSGNVSVTGAEQLDIMNLLYEVLQRLQWRESGPGLDLLGVRLRSEDTASAGTEQAEPAPSEILALIDGEFYRRSLAQYERNFRIPSQ
jgi:predicted Fe-S protein YdhL (DUF1289 family)